VGWEQEAGIKLLRGGPLRIGEHNAEGLMRGDAKSRGEFYQSRMASGSITSNRIADLENEPRSDSPIADQFLIPLNVVPASALDAHGMTRRDLVNMANALARAGWEPDDILSSLGLPPMRYRKDFVPITVQVDPSTLTDPTSSGGTSQ
jgi:hypothetical protein